MIETIFPGLEEPKDGLQAKKLSCRKITVINENLD
jgi:hypothetical protein